MKKQIKGKTHRVNRGRTTSKGREIVKSLTEAIAAERSGTAIDKHFTVRIVES